jgi:hypothetical protein
MWEAYTEKDDLLKLWESNINKENNNE